MAESTSLNRFNLIISPPWDKGGEGGLLPLLQLHVRDALSLERVILHEKGTRKGYLVYYDTKMNNL